jgi:hypothetical protein
MDGDRRAVMRRWRRRRLRKGREGQQKCQQRDEKAHEENSGSQNAVIGAVHE